MVKAAALVSVVVLASVVMETATTKTIPKKTSENAINKSNPSIKPSKPTRKLSSSRLDGMAVGGFDDAEFPAYKIQMVS